MRWLIHGSKITPAVAHALTRHKHTVVPVDPMPDSAADVFEAARSKQLEILTTDAGLAEAPFQGSAFGRTMVYLQLEGGDVEQDDAIDRLFDRYKPLKPGRLYTVTGTRVKIRQLPGA